MKTLIDVAVPSITFILLAAVGMDLTGEDFTRVRRRRLVVAAGLFAPLLLLPPLAVSLTVLFRPDPDTAAGVLLIASCPIGGISNSYSYLARASTALSVTLTGFSCLLASVTVPLIGHALELTLGRPLALEAPIPLLLAQLLLMLAAPVTLGMWIRRRWPGFADEHRMGLQRLAFGAIAAVLTLVILDNVGAFVEGLWSTVPLAASFVLCSMAVGWLTGMTVTSDPRDRFTLAAEFGTRNVAVAAAIAVTLLGRVEFARFATIYFLTELPLMLAAIAWFRANRG